MSAIVAAAGRVPVQLGGGIRTMADIEAALGLGVDRVILGSIALRDPELVRDAARQFPGRIVVGIDAREGRVAVEGWLETSEVRDVELARRFEDAGVAAILHTDIARDGTLEGPNFTGSAALASAVEVPVLLSGGVADEDDVVHAASYAAKGVRGVIVGRALYTGSLSLERALARLSCC